MHLDLLHQGVVSKVILYSSCPFKSRLCPLRNAQEGSLDWPLHPVAIMQDQLQGGMEKTDDQMQGSLHLLKQWEIGMKSGDSLSL